MKPKRPYSRRSASGTARIQREGYSTINTDWWTINAAVRKRDNNQCVFCGDPAKDVHHTIALSRGGTTTMSNLVSVCKDCHDKRHPGHPKRRS